MSTTTDDTDLEAIKLKIKKDWSTRTILDKARHAGLLTDLRLLYVPEGDTVPSSMMRHTVDFPDLIKYLEGSITINLSDKFVVLYEGEMKGLPDTIPSFNVLYSDANCSVSVPLSITFLSRQTLITMPIGYLLARSNDFSSDFPLGQVLDYEQAVSLLKPSSKEK